MSTSAKPPAAARRCVVLGAVGFWLAGPAAAQAAPKLARGDAVAWPALDLIDGSRLAPGDWSDTAAVVVFWATWCAYCRRHNAHVEKLHQATSGQRLRVLGVAVESEEAEVRRHLQAQGLHFPVAMAAAGLRAQFTARKIVPMTALVDRRGLLVQMIPGEMSEDDVMALASLARSPKP